MRTFNYDKPETVSDEEFLPFDMTELDAEAIFALASTMQSGAIKYGSRAWTKVPLAEHVNHAMAHMLLWSNNDISEDHLRHAFARMMMAVALDTKERKEDEGSVHHPGEPNDSVRR